MKFWIFPVTRENWEIATKRSIWALKRGKEKYRERIKKGDVLIFYVSKSRPPSFKGSYELVGDWVESGELLWDDEKKSGRVIYPYRAEIRPIQLGNAEYLKLVPKLSFVEEKTPPRTWFYLQGAPANFGRAIDENDYRVILEGMKQTPTPPLPPPKPPRPPKLSPKHNELRDILYEIGRLERVIPEKEYPIDSWKLDVVWKKIVDGVPSHAFEVQIGGNFYEALAKLKHAWDKWNSRPCFVTTRKYEEEAKRLIAGSFHELKGEARIINWRKIVGLYKLLKEASQIKEEIKL